METIALVSNGPSAVKFDDARGVYDCVIGVNLAATKWQCDWWCFSDFQMFEKAIPKGTPAIFTKRAVVQKIRENPVLAKRFEQRNGLLLHEDIRRAKADICVSMWNVWSGCAALGLVWHFKPKRVDVYGVDLGGIDDFTGNENSRDRTPWRWNEEKKIWNRMVDVLVDRLGIEIVRIV